MGQLGPAVVLYDASGVQLAVSDGVAIPANTRMLLLGGKSYDDKAYFAQVSDLGRISTTAYPPVAPPGTTPFVLAQDDAEDLEVGPNPLAETTLGSIVAASTDVHIQFVAGGAAGDPSESGSKIEVYWRVGDPAVDHLVERIYVSGATVALTMPDTRLARDGTAMVGNGTNTRIVLVRTRLSNSAQEIDGVVRGYLESI